MKKKKSTQKRGVQAKHQKKCYRTQKFVNCKCQQILHGPKSGVKNKHLKQIIEAIDVQLEYLDWNKIRIKGKINLKETYSLRGITQKNYKLVRTTEERHQNP